MGYSIICLSRGFHSTIRQPLRRKILHFKYMAKCLYRQKKKTYTDHVDFHLCRDCVCVCEFVRYVCLNQKPEEKGLFLRKKRPLYMEVTGPETWQVCILAFQQGHIQTKGFPALILSRLCQLTALSAVS